MSDDHASLIHAYAHRANNHTAEHKRRCAIDIEVMREINGEPIDEEEEIEETDKTINVMLKRKGQDTTPLKQEKRKMRRKVTPSGKEEHMMKRHTRSLRSRLHATNHTPL